MANQLQGGIRPWGTFAGGEGNYPAPRRAEIASGYSTALFRYDPIKRLSDGTVAVAAAGDTDILGVAIGFSYVTGGKRKRSNTVPASTTFSPSTVGSANASYCFFVACTPDVIFSVETNASVASVAAAENLVGENADHVAGTGDANTGVGAYLLDLSSKATSTAQWRIFDVMRTSDNDVLSTRFKLLVACNEGSHPFYTTSGV